MSNRFCKIIVSLFVFGGVACMVQCGDTPEQTSSVAPDTYLNHSDTARYVGMQTCRLCHQKIYDTFIQTGMGQSFATATKQKSVATFDTHTPIYDKYQDFYYHPFWKKDTMYILEFRLQGKDTTFKRVEKVDYIIGSGQHTNSHIHNSNGYLYQMPMTFFSQKKKWDFPPGFENGFNTHFTRKIGLECMSCHNALPEFVQGSENKFASVPEGINCERCHGPGSIHVQHRSTGEKIDTSRYIDYTIVNPGKLSIERQFDVCQRCHLQGNAVLKKGKSFFDFRPGMVLSDYISVFLPKYEHGEDEFIMASHADRLKQSQCFISSFKPSTGSGSLRPYKNALTCVTCHNPHISVKSTKQEHFNAACKNCHQPGSGSEICSENEINRNKVEDNCVSCHMPRSGSIDIPHVSIHDHYIRKPVKKGEVEKIRKFVGLYSINEKNPTPESKAIAYLQQYDKFDYNPVFLDSALHYLSDKTADDVKNHFENLVYLYFIKKDYRKILGYVAQLNRETLLKNILTDKSWSNDHAWTCYRIGEAYYHENDVVNAELFYQQAIRLSPFNAEFQNKLGNVYIAQQKIREAIGLFETVLKENPQNIQALTNLGYAYLISGNAQRADHMYNQGLKLNPDYEPLLLNVAGLHIFSKRYVQAKSILQHILQKNPKQEQARNVLNQLKSISPL